MYVVVIISNFLKQDIKETISKEAPAGFSNFLERIETELMNEDSLIAKPDFENIYSLIQHEESTAPVQTPTLKRQRKKPNKRGREDNDDEDEPARKKIKTEDEQQQDDDTTMPDQPEDQDGITTVHVYLTIFSHGWQNNNYCAQQFATATHSAKQWWWATICNQDTRSQSNDACGKEWNTR